MSTGSLRTLYRALDPSEGTGAYLKRPPKLWAATVGVLQTRTWRAGSKQGLPALRLGTACVRIEEAALGDLLYLHRGGLEYSRPGRVTHH